MSEQLTREKALEEVKKTRTNLNKQELDEITNYYSAENRDKELLETRLKELNDIISMRKKWSSEILWLIQLVVVVHLLFIVCVGAGILQFESQWTAPLFVGEAVLQVVSLAAIIVGFLFSKDSTSN